MDWLGVLNDVISGAAVAVVGAVLAILIARNVTHRRELSRAAHERNLAAAAELYRTYGDYYAAWKAWDFHVRGNEPKPPVGDDRLRAELVEKASAAEGSYESLLVRIALENNLSLEARAALWCLRFAFKELRYAIRKNVPLSWWRADIHGNDPGFRDYQAFKKSIARVAAIFIQDDGTPPGPMSARQRALEEITGDGKAFTENPRFASAVTAEQNKRRTAQAPSKHEWKWVVIAEELASHDGVERASAQIGQRGRSAR